MVDAKKESDGLSKQEKVHKKDYDTKPLPSRKQQLLLTQHRKLQQLFAVISEKYLSISNNFYLFDVLEMKAGSKVLDCGSGLGGWSFLFYLNKMEVYGIELSDRVDVTKKIYIDKKTSKRLRFRKGSIFREIYEGERFDFIYAKNFPIYYPDGINGKSMNLFLESIKNWSSDGGIFCWQIPSLFYGQRNQYILTNEDYLVMIKKIKNKFYLHHISYINTPEHNLDELTIVFISKNFGRNDTLQDSYRKIYDKYNQTIKKIDNAILLDEFINKSLNDHVYPGVGIREPIILFRYLYKNLFRSKLSNLKNAIELTKLTLDAFRYKDLLKYLINSQIFYLQINNTDSVNIMENDPFYDYLVHILKIIDIPISEKSQIIVSSHPKYIKNPEDWMII